MNIGITRISSKGQIVIPSEMRVGLKEGDELLIVKDEGRMILKTSDQITKQMREDLEFAKRTEEAMQRIEKGKGVKMSSENFLKKIKEW